jgi:phage terminase small subunit
MPKPTKKKLTPKQALFVKEYLIDFNATRAAKSAGYSEKTAKSQGQRLLTYVDIQKQLADETEKRNERTEQKQDRAVEMIHGVAEIDYADYETRRNIKGIELLARHHGLLLDKKEMKFDPNAPINWRVEIIDPKRSQQDEGDQ